MLRATLVRLLQSFLEMHKNIIVAIVLILSAFNLQAQTEFATPKADTLILKNGLLGSNRFMYRYINVHYITNENGYYLDVFGDTSYLIFQNTGKKFEYKAAFYADINAKRPKKFPVSDTIKSFPIIVKFDSASGKIVELVNWKLFRDFIVSDYSRLVKYGKATAAEFEDYKRVYNQEPLVRYTVMTDISSIFGMCGDTIRTDAEYLQIKQLKSPYTGQDLFVMGKKKLNASGNPTAKNYVIVTENRADENVKPILFEEAQKLLASRTPAGETITQVKSVDLNSEGKFAYNHKLGRFFSVQLYDITELNGSARANNRYFDLLGVE